MICGTLWQYLGHCSAFNKGYLGLHSAFNKALSGNLISGIQHAA